MTPTRIVPVLALSWLLGAAACDSQVGTGFAGEPLAIIHGSVRNELAPPPDAAEALLVWENFSGSPDIHLAETAEVGGSFPAAFELEILSEPPAELLNDFTRGGSLPDESRFGIALMAVVAPDQDLEDLDAATVYGLAEDHILVYAETDVQPGTDSELFLGAPLEAGFHVMDVVRVGQPGCEDGGLFDCLRPAPGNLDAVVPIRLADLADLDPPNIF